MTIDSHHGLGQTAQLASPAGLAAAASLQAQLSEARVLVAETRLRCETLLEAAQREAQVVICEARVIGHRIIADARSQVTGEDTRPRSSFSRLWDQADSQDAEIFFSEIPLRDASEVFSA